MFQDIADEFGLEDYSGTLPPRGLYYTWLGKKLKDSKILSLNIYCMGLEFRERFISLYPNVLEFVERLKNVGYKVKMEKADPIECNIYFIKIILK